MALSMVITSLQGMEGGGEERKGQSSPTLTTWCGPHCSPSLDLVLGQGLDHLSAQVVYGFHLCGLEGQLAHLGALRGDMPGKGLRDRPDVSLTQLQNKHDMGQLWGLDEDIHCHNCGDSFLGACVSKPNIL